MAKEGEQIGLDLVPDGRHVFVRTEKVLMCGDRMKGLTAAEEEWYQQLIIGVVEEVYRLGFRILIHGDCVGVDKRAGYHGFHERGMIEVKCAANWGRHDRGGGAVRNRAMMKLKPDLVVGIHRDIRHSTGTRDMLRVAMNMIVPNVLVEKEADIGRIQEACGLAVGK